MHTHMNKGPWGQESPFQRKPEKDAFKNIFGNGPSGFFGGPQFYLAIMAIALVIWLAMGFYQVNPDEEGIVLRFGAIDRVSVPGWHYHLPYPIERVLKPKVTTTSQINIGFGNQDESQMLTGDRNIVDISVIVQYHIKDPKAYLFNMRQPQLTVKAVTESAIREIIGRMPIELTFAERRSEIQVKAKELVQHILDAYGAGVQITEVNLKDVNPPQQVIESFREVERANSDQERMLNEAQSYYNDVVPKARGESSRIQEEGLSDKEKAIKRAEGDVARFNAYVEARKNDPTLEDRLYFETMEHVLKGKTKIVTSGGPGVLPHMAIAAAVKPTVQEKSND